MLDELHHFLLIAEHGTFTAAARRAHLSQPALTASIRRLESDLGAQLFHRGPGGTELTAAGRALLPRAQAALAAVADGRRAVAEIQGLQAGHVSIGAGATVMTYLLPPILARFRRRHPQVRFRLREANSAAHVRRALESGTLDLGIITGVGDDPWRDDELILVAAPNRDPRDPSFVTLVEGSATRSLLHQHFPDADVVMELNSIAAVKGHVRAGIGKALLSRVAVNVDLQAGRLVAIDDPQTPIQRKFALIHRGLERLPPAAAALRALLLGHRPPRRIDRPTAT